MKKLFVFGNGVDWCAISLRGLMHGEYVFLLNEKLPMVKNSEFAKVHFSIRMNRYFDFPFKTIWFRNVINLIKKNVSINDEIVLVIFDWNFFGGERQFVKYIRCKVKSIKTVYLFTNIVKCSFAYQRGYVDKLNDWYDVVFAFDPEDAKRYNFSYSPLIYDADPTYKREEKESRENLVFYVGQAKDRLDGLLSCYERLSSLGIKCDFHIANVPDWQMKNADRIVYNKFMTYEEAVESIQRSTCLIDVIQGDSTGLTLKVCEAVCYDKKLITTNKHVVEYPFYDPKYIRVIESSNDIDLDFFIQNRDVHYSDEGKRYFSADSFLERLETALERNSVNERRKSGWKR